METRPPGVGRIAIAVAFVLSCFGLMLFLWLSFGGPTPLAPKGYEFTTYFKEGTGLHPQADVRISGVSVGTVEGVSLDRIAVLQQTDSSSSLQEQLEFARGAVEQFEAAGDRTSAAEAWETVASAYWGMARWASMPAPLERAAELFRM